MKTLQTALKRVFDFILPLGGARLIAESISPEEFSHRTARTEEALGPDTLAPFKYSDPLAKALIRALKYKRSEHAAEVLAEVIHEDLVEFLSDHILFNNFTNPVLIPIPLSKTRQRERGFNQTTLLAHGIKKRTPELELVTEVLVRTKNTPSQTSMKKREDRIKNVRGCFEIENPEKVRGRNVIILDDVITTGATMKEARDALLDAGARQVLAVAVAH